MGHRWPSRRCKSKSLPTRILVLLSPARNFGHLGKNLGHFFGRNVGHLRRNLSTNSMLVARVPGGGGGGWYAEPSWRASPHIRRPPAQVVCRTPVAFDAFERRQAMLHVVTQFGGPPARPTPRARAVHNHSCSLCGDASTVEGHGQRTPARAAKIKCTRATGTQTLRTTTHTNGTDQNAAKGLLGGTDCDIKAFVGASFVAADPRDAPFWAGGCSLGG